MDAKDLLNRFTYHAPSGNQPERYAEIRDALLHMSLLINNLCPDSREKSLAITYLEEVGFWANASIARNENKDA